MSHFVLDASVALAWYVDNPMPAYAKLVKDALEQGRSAIAPALWSLEMANGLHLADRRGNLTAEQVDWGLQQLELLTRSVVEIENSVDFDSRGIRSRQVVPADCLRRRISRTCSAQASASSDARQRVEGRRRKAKRRDLPLANKDLPAISPYLASNLAGPHRGRKPAPRAPFLRFGHSHTQGPKNNFHEALDVYRNSRILTNGSRLSQKLRADQGIHSRVSGGSSA